MCITCKHSALALTETHLLTVTTPTKNMKASNVTYVPTAVGTLVIEKSQGEYSF